MNDKQLRLFLAVADQGSFSKAEGSAYISKQAMLRQINALEQEVGVPLLRRSATGISLTPAGREFYSGAKRLLKLQGQVVEKCRGAEPQAEVLRVGQVEHQALLHRVTDAFALKYPDIQIRKVIHPNHSGEFRVANDIIDVGETFYTELVARQANAYTKLADMPYLVAMRPGHPLSGRKSLSLADLTGYPTNVFELMVKAEYRARLRQAFEECGRGAGLIRQKDPDDQVRVAFLCGTTDQLLLTANPFITEIPELVTLPLDTGWTQEYGIIYRPDPAPVVRKYVDLAVALFKGI